jgi:acyl-CoA synthetase (AMP-forming)/AMP-acid ligase II
MQPFLPLTLADTLETNASLYPDHVAFVCGDRRLTHRQYLERSRRLASAWYKLGVRRQDRISILAQNSMEYLEVYGAGEVSGFITATVNWRLAGPEMEFIINDAAPKVLVFDEAYAPIIDSFRKRLKGVERFVCIGTAPAWADEYEDVLSSGDVGGPPCRASEEDIAYLIYTSGTTGRPKGCILGQREMRHFALTMSPSQHSTPADRCLLMMPFFHIGAKVIQLGQHYVGGTVFIQRGFDAEAVLKCIATERITITHMAPVMVQMLFDSPNIGAYDVTSLHTLIYSAAPMPTPVLKRGLKLWGDVFMQMYGQTEGIVTGLWHHQHRPDGSEQDRERLGSVGQPYNGVQLRLIDDSGGEVPQGVPGEVTYRSTAMFRGYWNNSAATIETLRGGWCHSGDIGKLDKEGFLYLVDRKKDMIISGGENIYSREVEEAVVQHPAVSECAVIGMPDDKWGEGVCAIVVLKQGMSASEDDLITHSQALIASYKKPRKIVFVNDIPKLPSGKVNKIELRKTYAAK